MQTTVGRAWGRDSGYGSLVGEIDRRAGGNEMNHDNEGNNGDISCDAISVRIPRNNI